MIDAARRALASGLSWLIGYGGSKGAGALASLIVINGKPVPVEDVQKIIAAVAQAAKMGVLGDGSDKIRAEIAPAFIDVAEDVASLLVPYGGTAVALAVWAVEHARPMTFDEQLAWMNRASEAQINTGG